MSDSTRPHRQQPTRLRRAQTPATPLPVSLSLSLLLFLPHAAQTQGALRQPLFCQCTRLLTLHPSAHPPGSSPASDPSSAPPTSAPTDHLSSLLLHPGCQNGCRKTSVKCTGAPAHASPPASEMYPLLLKLKSSFPSSSSLFSSALPSSSKQSFFFK